MVPLTTLSRPAVAVFLKENTFSVKIKISRYKIQTNTLFFIQKTLASLVSYFDSITLNKQNLNNFEIRNNLKIKK